MSIYDIVTLTSICDDLKDNMILCRDYFANLDSIKNSAFLNENDLAMYKSKSIMYRTCDYTVKYDAAVSCDRLEFVISGSDDGIVGIKMLNGLTTDDITSVVIIVGASIRVVTSKHIEILKHLWNFENNEIPFIPFKTGLTTSTTIHLSIRTKTETKDQSYAINVEYSKNISHGRYYFDYIFHDYVIKEDVSTKILNDEFGTILINYIACTSDLQIGGNGMIIKPQCRNIGNNIKLYNFAPHLTNHKYGIKADKYSDIKIYSNNDCRLTLVVLKTTHI